MIQRIKDTVQAVTGISFEEFAEKGRRQDRFYPRIIFVHCCLRYVKPLSHDEISAMVNREKTKIYYYERCFSNEIRFNRKFRETVCEVEKILNKQVLININNNKNKQL